MGTRSICGVRCDDQDKLSYNYSDGYPSGVGADILSELQECFTAGLYYDTFYNLRHLAREARLVDELAAPTEEDRIFVRNAKLIEHDDVATADGWWYRVTRGLQGSIVKRLKAGIFTDNREFILDSRFCEFGYILNLDEECFEIYRGFQKNPHNKGRYSGFKPMRENIGNDPAFTYYACALIGTFPLTWINSVTVKDIEALDQ